MIINKVFEVRFFLTGDADGTLHTKDFNDYHSFELWKEDMGNSAEIFSSREVFVIKHNPKEWEAEV